MSEKNGLNARLDRVNSDRLAEGGAWLGAGATWRARQRVRSSYTLVARQASPYQHRLADERVEGCSWVPRG